MFSSLNSCLNQARIFERASDVLTICSQSRDGPWAEDEVMISTKSPFSSSVDSGTMRPLTFAPTHLLPTAVWME